MPCKFKYKAQFLDSPTAHSQKNYALIKHETPETLMGFIKVWTLYTCERKISFAGPATFQEIQTFINQVLNLATFFGASLNAEEVYETMFVLCW